MTQLKAQHILHIKYWNKNKSNKLILKVRSIQIGRIFCKVTRSRWLSWTPYNPSMHKPLCRPYRVRCQKFPVGLTAELLIEYMQVKYYNNSWRFVWTENEMVLSSMKTIYPGGQGPVEQCKDKHSQITINCLSNSQTTGFREAFRTPPSPCLLSGIDSFHDIALWIFVDRRFGGQRPGCHVQCFG